MTHHLGEDYRYPNDQQRFKLVAVDDYLYRFACGHWCTENVFLDLIRCRTGVQNYLTISQQLTLF